MGFQENLKKYRESNPSYLRQQSAHYASNISSDLGFVNPNYNLSADFTQPFSNLNSGGFISQFLNTLDNVNLGSAKTKLEAINTDRKKKENELADLGRQLEKLYQTNDIVKASILENQYKKKKQELDEYNKQSEADILSYKEEIEGLTKDIAGRPESLDFKWLSRMAQKEPNSSVADYLKYEFGSDTGSSFSTISSQLASIGTQQLIKFLNKRGLSAAIASGLGATPGGWVGGAVAAGITVGAMALDLGFMYNMRKNETEAEMNEAFEGARQEKIAQYMRQNNITDPAELEKPEHKYNINKIDIELFEGLEGLRRKNMALGWSDAFEKVLAVTPYTNFTGKLFGTNRWLRTAESVASMGLNMHMEQIEEGTQWIYQQQYANKMLGKNNFGLKDEGDYKKYNFLNVGAQVLDDAFEAEKAILGIQANNSIYFNDEFRSSVNAGALGAGPMVTVPGTIKVIADHIGYARAKSALGKAAKSDLATEYLRFKYNTYFRFLENNEKPDYFIDSIRALAKNPESGITKEQAEKEVVRFKKAQKAYEAVTSPKYLGGLIEMVDLRPIAKVDKIEAAKSSLMIQELQEMQMDIETLKAKEMLENPAFITGIDLEGQSLKPVEGTTPTGEKQTGDLISADKNRKQLFEALLDPEKRKDLSIGKNELYDNFDIPILLLDRQIEKLQKKIKSIADGSYTATRKENIKLAKEGTEQQRSQLAYRTGKQYTSNPNMVGFDGNTIGQDEYVEFLEDLEATSYLRDSDKRTTVEQFLELETEPLDTYRFAKMTKAPLEQRHVDDITNSLQNKLYTLLGKADEIKDKDGSSKEFFSIDELKDAIDEAYGEDPDYHSALSAIHEQVKKYDDAITDIRDNNVLEVRDPKAVRTSKLDKQIQFVKDRFLREMQNELEKAQDDDYLDTQNLEKLKKKLEWLKNVLLDEMNLGTSTDPKISDLRDTINDIARAIDDAILDTRKRLANKDLQQEEAYTRSTSETASGYGLGYQVSDNKDNLLSFLRPNTPDAIKAIVKAFIDAVAVQDKSGKWFLHHSYIKAIGEFMINSDKNYLEDLRAYSLELSKLVAEKVRTESEKIYGANNAYIQTIQNYIALFQSDPEVALERIVSDLGKHTLLSDLSNPITEYLTTKNSKVLDEVGDWIVTPGHGEPDYQKALFADILKNINTIKALHKVTTVEENKHNIKAQLENELKVFATLTEFLPTKQQIVVLRQLNDWFHAKHSGFHIATVLGYAGTGKTQVVTKMLMKMLNIGTNQVIGVGPTVSSNKNLALALGKSEPNSTNPIKDFCDTPSANFKDVKLIIIDEAGLLTYEQRDALYAKAKELQNDYGTKTIFMGDPTQFSNDVKPPFIRPSTQIALSNTYTTPLTITYRTDDIDIIRAQKAFRAKSDRVTEVVTAYTADGKFGSMGVSSLNDLLNILQKNKPNGRQQMVIVNDDAAAASVRTQLKDRGITDVPVYSIIEAQSHTIDEAYVYLTPSGILTRQEDSYAAFNKAMYVATSRAKQLLVMASNDITFSNDSKSLLKEETKQPLDPEKKKEFLEDLKKQLDAITGNTEISNGIGAVTTAVPTPPPNPGASPTPGPTTPAGGPANIAVDPDDIDYEFGSDLSDEFAEGVQAEINNELNDQETLDKSGPTVSFDDTEHRIRFPQYQSIKSGDKRFNQGAEVRYIKYQNADNNEIGVAVIAKAKNGKWYVIGIIGKDEYKETDAWALPKKLVEKIMSPDFTNTSNIFRYRRSEHTNDDGSLKISDDDVSANTLLFANLRNVQPKFLLWGKLKPLKEFMSSMFEGIIKNYMAASRNVLNTGKDSKITGKYVKIYNRKEINTLNLNPRVVQAGIPYLVFNIEHSKGGKEQFFIPLTGRNINRDKDSNAIKPLIELLTLTKEIEKVLENLDGDVKIKWGGIEAVEGFNYSSKITGKEYRSTQGEVFLKLLRSNTTERQKVMNELASKGIDTTQLSNKLDEVRKLLFTSLDLTKHGFQPGKASTNQDGENADYMNKYFTPGTAGSRKAVPGTKKVGNSYYTPGPEEGFYLIEKGTKGEKAYRKVYNYKGVQVKIDIPINPDGTLGRARFELHDEAKMAAEGLTRNNNLVTKTGGTRIYSGEIFSNHDYAQYVENQIDNGLITDKTQPSPADAAFDALARANSSVIVNNKRVWLRRDATVIHPNTGTRSKFMMGINLTYAPGFIDQDRDTAFHTYTHTTRPSDPRGTLPPIAVEPITTEVLDALVGDNAWDDKGNSNANGGFGLILPINTEDVAQKANEDEATWRARQEANVFDNLRISWGETSPATGKMEGVVPTEITVGNISDTLPGASEPAMGRAEDPIGKTEAAEPAAEAKPNPYSHPTDNMETFKDNTEPLDWSKNSTTPKRWVSQKKLIKIATKIFGAKWANDPNNLKFLTQAAMIRERGLDVWGNYTKGVTRLLQNEEGKISIDILMHEAVHRVLDVVFDVETVKGFYSLARKLSGQTNATNRQAEEWIAEEFVKYNRDASLVSKLLWRYLRKLKMFFNMTLTNRDLLEMFFDDIERGVFNYDKSIDTSKSSVPMDRLKILEWFGDKNNNYEGAHENFVAAQQYLFESLASLLWPKMVVENDAIAYNTGVVAEANFKEDRRYVDNLPVPPKEAKAMVFSRIKLYAKQLKDAGEDVPYWLEQLANKDNKIFQNLFDYLIQNDEIDWTKFDEFSSNFGDDPSLKDDIEEFFRVNYQTSLLGNVKNLLSTVFVEQTLMVDKTTKEGETKKGKESKKVFIPMRTVFAILRTIGNGVTNLDSKGMDQIRKNVSENYNSDPKVKAILNMIDNLYQMAKMDKFWDNTKIKAIDGKEIRNKRNLPTNIMTSTHKVTIGNTTFTRPPNMVQAAFYAYVVDEAIKQNLSFTIDGVEVKAADLEERAISNMLATSLTKNLSKDALAGLQTGVFSLVERDPYVAIIRVKNEYDFVPDVDIHGNLKYGKSEDKFSVRYSPNKIAGAEQTVKLDILNSVVELLRTSPSLVKNVADLLQNGDRSSLTDVKKKALESAFKSLGIPYDINKLSASSISSLIQSLKGILDSIGGLTNSEDDIAKALVLLKEEQNKRFKEITDIISIHEGFIENSRYLDSTNRPQYKYVMGSFLTRTLGSILTFGKSVLPSYLRPGKKDEINPAYDHYYKHNPFVRDLNESKEIKTLRRLITHDGIKINEDSNEAISIPYKNEGLNGWVARTLLFGFVKTISRTEGLNSVYIQFFYTPSNKTSCVGMEMTLPSKQEFNNRIKAALIQQLERYTWYQNIAGESNVFLDEIPLREKNGVLVWEGDLPPSFINMYNSRNTKLPSENSKEWEKIVEEVNEKLNKEAFEYFKYLQDNDLFTINRIKEDNSKNKDLYRDNDLEPAISKLLSAGHLSKEDLINFYNAVEKEYGHLYSNLSDNEKRSKLTTLSYRAAIINAQYKLNYVNGHFLNQLVMSDTALYGGTTSQIKRGSGPISPGNTGLIDNDNSGVGMKPNFRIAVAEDDNVIFNNRTDIAQAYEALHGLSINPADAQMYYLPEWRKELEKGFSSFFNIGSVLKPVIYFIDKFGIVRFSKNSGIELTDQLCRKFPELDALRNDMRKAGVEELHMASAVKVGQPARKLKNGEKLVDHINVKNSNGNCIIDVPSTAYSIQLNPVSSEGDVTNFSQLTYFFNVNKLNDEATDMIYKIDAEIMTRNFDKWLKQIGKVINGKVIVDEEKVRKILAKAVADLPGYERFEELITHKENGKYVIGLDFPALKGRVLISLMSEGAKNSVKSVKGKGSKLILQADHNVEVFRIGDRVLTYDQLEPETVKEVDAFYSLSYGVKKALKTKANFKAIGDLNQWEANKEDIFEYHDLSQEEKDIVNNYDINFVPTRLNIVNDNKSMTGRVAEVFAPAWWLKYMHSIGREVKEGDIIMPDDFLTRLAFGVRIPSTGIHSAVPMKIVGSVNIKDNIIIAPQELVALHGSDFDVDSLFVIRTMILTNSEDTPVELTDMEGNVIIKKGQRLGWPYGVAYNNFEEMMMAQGATEDKIKVNYFESTLSQVQKLINEVRGKLEVDPNNKELQIKLNRAENAYIGTMQNQKMFTTLWILLNKQNRSDMMQPITFEGVKEDLFSKKAKFNTGVKTIKIMKDGMINPEFMEYFTEENRKLYREVDKFMSWGITKNDDIKVEGNKLVIKDEIRRNILNDTDLSVKMKLQVLAGVIDFEAGRNLNNQLHNLQYYVENFAGVSLTGIFANFVKALAYTYYAAPKDSVFIDSRKQEVSVSINGKKYDRIATRENRDKGKKIWEVLDTLINSAIDNVKEQVLQIINANNRNGNIMATMVAMGIPLQTVALIMRQPVITKEANNIGTTSESSVNKGIRVLNEKIDAILKSRKEILDKKIKDGIITQKEIDAEARILAEYDSKEVNYNIETNVLENVLETTKLNNAYNLEDLSTEHLYAQLKVLQLYQKIGFISIPLANAAKAINIVRDFPVTPEDIQDLNETISKLEAHSGIKDTDLFSIPHIKTSKTIYNQMLDIVKQVIRNQSDAFSKTLQEIAVKTFGMSGSSEDIQFLNDNLDRYILSSVTSISTLDEKWKTPVQLSTDKGIYELSENDAWVHNFGTYIEKLKRENPLNLFLKYLKPIKNKRGTYIVDGQYSIFWEAGDLLNDPARAAAVQEAFMALPVEAQQQIMKFAAVSYGYSFSFKNYSSLIPPNILKEAAFIHDDVMNKLMDKSKFDKISQHFAINFAILNPDSVASWSRITRQHGKKISRKKKVGDTFVDNTEFTTRLGGRNPKAVSIIVDWNSVINDKTGKEQEYSEPPLMFKSMWGDSGHLYLRIDSDLNTKHSYYIEIAEIPYRGVDSYRGVSKEILENGYKASDYFDATTPTYSVLSTELGKEEITIHRDSIKEANLPKVGDRINIKHVKDLYNLSISPYVVTAVKSKLVNKDITEVVEHNPENGGVINESAKLHEADIILKKAPVKEQRKPQVNQTATLNQIKKLLNKLTKVLNLSYEIVDFQTDPIVGELGLDRNIAGFFHNGKVYLNSNMLNSETPIHEFGHALILIVKANNKVLYNNLVNQIKDSAILEEVKRNYPDLTEEEQIEEAIVTAIGRYGNNMTQGFTKELLKAIKRIFEYIYNKLGIPSKKVNIAELGPNTTISELAALLLDEREIAETLDNSSNPKPLELRYLFKDPNITTQVGTEADAEHYRIMTPTGTKIIQRVSKFLENFNPYKTEFDQATFEADRLFKKNKTPKTASVPHPSLTSGTLNYEEAVEYFKKEIEKRKLRGKVIHKIIQIYFTPDTSTMKASYIADKEALMREYQTAGGLPTDFLFLTPDYLNDLRARLGIIDSDQVMSEVMVHNDKLDLGGTIDMMIKHADGTVSIYDFKTGSLNDEGGKAMLYNRASKLNYNQLSRSYMQLGTYALLLKSQYPDLRFRTLGVVSLNRNNSNIPIYEIDRFKVFTTLREYFTYNPNEVINSNPSLLNHNDYFAVGKNVSELLKAELRNVNNIFEARTIVLRRLYDELDKIRRTGGKDGMPVTADYLSQNRYRLLEMENLIRSIQELEGSEFGSSFGNERDMSSPEMMTSVGFNVDNPMLKTFMKLRNEALAKVYKQRNELYLESDELVGDLMKEKYGSNFLKRKLGIGLDYTDLFKFMWKDDPVAGKVIVTEEDPQWGNLSPAEQRYNVFYREGIRDLLFSTLSTQRGIDYYTTKLANINNDKLVGLFTEEQLREKYSEKIKWLKSLPKVEKWNDELGKNFVYYESFTPRLPKLAGEMKNNITELATKEGLGRRIDALTDWALNKVTRYNTQKDSRFRRVGVPLKYINDYNAHSEEQTMHTELIFKVFAKNMINKRNYDDVSVFGQTLVDIYSFKTETRDPLVNTSKFLKNFINNNLHDIADEDKVAPLSGLSTVTIYGRPFSLERLTRTFISAVTLAKLSFSILGAGYNLGLNLVMTAKNAVKGSIAKRSITDLNEADVEFSTSDLIWAFGQYMIHLKNMIAGKGHEDKFALFNKMYNVSQQQFVGTSNKEMLKAAKNRPLDTKWIYLTYGIGDSMANSLIFMALMKHKQNVDGNSMWDSYEVKNNRLVYTGPVRGVTEEGTAITELTGHEMNRLKKAAARIVGEYDPDTKRMMESNGFLMMFLQFRKYLPNTLEQGWQGISRGDFENASLGKYVEVLEGGVAATDASGNPILRWESQIDKGANIVAAGVTADAVKRVMKVLFRFAYSSKALENEAKNGGKYWDTLSNDQKQQVINTYLNVAVWLLITVAMMGAYGDSDDDDKDPIKRRILDLGRDVTASVNYVELLKLANKPTIVLPALLETVEGINKLLFGDVKWEGLETPGMKGATTLVPFQGTVYQNIVDPWYDKE